MTKKRFIKKLRSYGLSRHLINCYTKCIAENKGRISYNEYLETIQLGILKRLIKDTCKEIPIDFNYAPVEFVDLKISKLDIINTTYILGADLALNSDKAIVSSQVI